MKFLRLVQICQSFFIEWLMTVQNAEESTEKKLFVMRVKKNRGLRWCMHGCTYQARQDFLFGHGKAQLSFVMSEQEGKILRFPMAMITSGCITASLHDTLDPKGTWA